MNVSNKRSIRWWPLVAIAVLAACSLLYAILSGDGSRQSVVMSSIGIGAGAFALSWIWLLALSRLTWRSRIGISSGVLALGLSASALFRYEGVSGDLMPILRWRWTQAAKQISETATAPAESVQIGSYPQFLGPNRNAKVSGIPLDPDWESHPPQLLWKQAIGEAWSGFAISGNRAITQEQSGKTERVVCYDFLTGALLWENRLATRYDNPLGGIGPRATPTIDGDRVYTMGAMGDFQCLDLSSGKTLWGHNVLEKHGATLPDWGMSGSPLIYEDLVILSAGGPEGHSLVAYEKITGELAWSGGSDQAHWSSPVYFEIAGRKQILIFNRSAVVAHDVKDGEIIWEFPWKKSGYTPRVAVPVSIPGDRVLISSGYGAGSALLQISANDDGTQSVQALWTSLHLKSKFNNFVFNDGYVYALDDGMLTCIDIETGRRAWKKGRYGHGQMILTDDFLLLSTENGEIILLDPVPQEPRILGRFKALKGKSWNPPALVGPYLLLRNHLEAACYKLPLFVE